jgi:multidrug efflux pump subunit AcrA (membrane-fusion protein)
MKKNNINKPNNNNAGKSKTAGRLIWFMILIVIISLAIAYDYFHSQPRNANASSTTAGTFPAQRGDLTVSVIENGDLKPLNSLIIKSKVEKRSTTIISIVDEGTYISQEDVNNGMILVELDTSEIRQELMEEEIKYLDGKADMTTAKEAYDIQLIQNESDIEAGKIMVRFGMMDLQKYLGALVAKKVIASAEDSNSWQDNVSIFIDDPNLGGEALQMIRELSSTITLTQAQLARAQDKLKGTQELYDSNYVAEIEKKGDELDVQSLVIQKEQDETAKALYLKYEFPKQVVTLLSAYHEALRELDKIHAKARSELAKARGEHDKEKAKFVLQEEELNHEREQLDFCTIRAPAPGDVVYASSTESSSRRRSSRTIELGASISERQSIISIPDPSVMKIEIKIHETWIDKIKIGQKTKINVTAFPEESLTGEVIKKAPMADPEEWLNPDLKVYSTDIKIDGTHDQLKTGMTAKVEIIVQELKDVISVPIQTVINIEGQKICYIDTINGPQKRQVETGAFNDNFVEIKSGLDEGEKVLLNPPRRVEVRAQLK